MLGRFQITLSEVLLLIFPFSLMILEIANNVIQCNIQNELLIKAYWSSDNVPGRFQKRQEPVTWDGDKQVELGGYLTIKNLSEYI